MSVLNQPPAPKPAPVLQEGQISALTKIANGFKQDPQKVIADLLEPDTIFTDSIWIKEAKDAEKAVDHVDEMKHGLVRRFELAGAIFTGDRNSPLNYTVGSWVLALLSENWKGYTEHLQGYVDLWTKG